MPIDITLFSSPQTFFTRYPISSRILTSNLEKEKRFRIHSTATIPLMCYTKSVTLLQQKYKSILENSDETYARYADAWCGSTVFGRFPIFYIFSGKFDREILDRLETEVIFFTAYTVLDFRVVKILLNDNRKVVLGGSSTFVYEPELIRKFLLEMGADEDKVKNNLIVVRGYVDKNTDLYKIFEKWEDTEIKENDFSSFWDCTEDVYMKHVRVYKGFFNTEIGALLTPTCWWGKCTFCTYTCFPHNDFIKGVSVDKLVEHFNIISKNYDSRNIFFHDSYINPTAKSKELFKRLSEEGFKMSFYTGIKLLKNPKYIDFLNDCNMDRIYIGAEHSNDFQLETINKGYGRKELFEMIDVFKKHLKREIIPVILLMVDLPSNAPSKKDAIQEIKDNYRTFYDIRQELKNEGFAWGAGCQFNLAPLRHFPKTNLVDGNLLRHATSDQMSSDQLIGIFGMYKYLSEKLDIDISEIENSKCLSEPLVRYLPNGEMLESDMFYVDKEVIEDISRWK